MTQQPDRAPLLELVVSSWRATRIFGSALEKLDVLERQRYIAQLRYFAGRIEACAEAGGLRLVNLEGASYDSGMAITPLNLEDFPRDSPLVVATMLEPVVMNDEGVLRLGTAVLREADR